MRHFMDPLLYLNKKLYGYPWYLDLNTERSRLKKMATNPSPTMDNILFFPGSPLTEFASFNRTNPPTTAAFKKKTM